jgi:hypothetical protein
MWNRLSVGEEKEKQEMPMKIIELNTISVPPFIKNVRELIDPKSSELFCPVCGFEFLHFGVPYLTYELEEYPIIIIPLWGECGHECQLWISFYKGNTTMKMRYSKEASFDTDWANRVIR